MSSCWELDQSPLRIAVGSQFGDWRFKHSPGCHDNLVRA